jgi:hypothetical protein
MTLALQIGCSSTRLCDAGAADVCVCVCGGGGGITAQDTLILCCITCGRGTAC